MHALAAPRAPSSELEAILAGEAPQFARLAQRQALAVASGDHAASARVEKEAAALFARLLSFSDLLGRRRAQLLYRGAVYRMTRPERHAMAAGAAWRLAAVPRDVMLPATIFEEAVRDILDREPRLAVGYLAVQRAYASDHAFACAKSMTLAVTRRVQEVVTAHVRGGAAAPADPVELIREAGRDWSQSYAQMVFETNVATAYSAGLWGRLADPDVGEVLPGARFVSAWLPTSRPNHTACHGLVAPTSSALWDRFSPPLGYRCACAVDEISIFDAEREGLVRDGKLVTLLPPGFGISAFPDPGFGAGRPDRVALFGSSAGR